MALLDISPDTLLSSLTKYNPWWEDRNYSFHFKRKREYYKNFRSLVLNKGIQRTVILMGPRRVGKTVMLRQLIHDVLRNRTFSSSDVFFISVDDPVYNNMSLQKLINLFQQKTQHNPKTKKLIIFDEVQYLKNWERHLKVLTDKYSHIRFVASGSSAAALKRQSAESGAGRFTDFFLPPLTFKEFIDLSKKTKPNSIKEWNEEFINYINFGGYPEPIFNEAIQKDVSRFIGQDVIDKVLLRDLPALYGISDTQELNSLFTTVAFNSGQEINLESLTKKSSIAKNTIQKYLTYLESAFLIRRVYRIDDSCKKFKRERFFKVYLTNPSMYSALFGPVKDKSENIGHIIETAVFSQHFHTEDFFRKKIFYARWKKSNKEFEVDLVRTNKNYRPQTLLEIKWNDRHVENPGELEGLLDMAIKHKQKVVYTTSKTKYVDFQYTHKNNNIKFISWPCSDFCYSIGELFLEDGGINESLVKSLKKDK